MIRVLVVDDHELVRIGLRQILADYPAIRIVAEAADGETALRLNRRLKPDIVLLDVQLPGLSGFEVTSRLKQASPGVGIIILSVHEHPPFPEQLIGAGASAAASAARASRSILSSRLSAQWRSAGRAPSANCSAL